MSDRRKAEEKMSKAIFISADCWLCVFDLLRPRQLGLGISMISHRFDFYFDEHFRTRKWSLKPIELLPKYEADGIEGMPEEFISATIIPNNGNLGLTLSTEIILSECNIDELKMVLIATMAGKAAEELLIGRSEGHEGDIEAARPVAKQLLRKKGRRINERTSRGS
ncbi:hypothetical protein niasHT_024957 [Heterodera trifolii]|uniref:Uncharacterized protein n=1 Tax=Heterodera trifolii TaxID=157864 RepID=A0ABD2JAJ2_9BILA